MSSHLSNPRHHKDLVLSREGASWKARLERKEWVTVFHTESHESTKPWKDFRIARWYQAGASCPALVFPNDQPKPAGFPFLLCSGALSPDCQHRKLLVGILFREGCRRNTECVLLSALSTIWLGLNKPLHKAVPSLVSYATHRKLQRCQPSFPNAFVQAQKGSIFSKLERSTLVSFLNIKSEKLVLWFFFFCIMMEACYLKHDYSEHDWIFIFLNMTIQNHEFKSEL